MGSPRLWWSEESMETETDRFLQQEHGDERERKD